MKNHFHPSLQPLIQQLEQATTMTVNGNNRNDQVDMSIESTYNNSFRWNQSSHLCTNPNHTTSRRTTTRTTQPSQHVTSHSIPQNNNNNMPTTSTLPVHPNTHAGPVVPTSSNPLLLLQDILRDENDLSMLNHDTLQLYLAPILNALKAMDAESVMELKRTSEQNGAVLTKNIHVKAIHNEIEPPKSPSCPNQNIVRYLHVSEVENRYSIGIFVFPPGACIPLHDHPGMCVLSRVLYGDLHRTSLDLVRQEPPQDHGWISNLLSSRRHASAFSDGRSCAIYNGVDYLQAPAVTVLYPYEGNLHEFVAGPKGAAVLDVLLPPYSGDRDCTFYSLQPHDGKIHQKCWIVPTGQPENFHCLSGQYRHLGVAEEEEDENNNVDE